MDFKQAREKAGLTLERAAELAKYSKGTISDLENHGEGSERLKQRLMEVYGVKMIEGRPFQQVAPTMHEVSEPYSNRNSLAIAKLQKHAQSLEHQLLTVREIIKDLES